MKDDQTGRKRVLIFVVAYNAETTIQWVLSRIPVEDLPPETEILVIDDSSADRTFEVAGVDGDRLGNLRLTVLSNPENQGYGGNQKLGYEYAIEHGFDVVALLHGDGQYAPEKLPDLVRPVLSGEADACFGSRMIENGAARRSGMPLYKAVGNRVLTAFENSVLGMALSEFHSGYRVYAVDALRRLPFRYNTNEFHFDTDIIIQFGLAGLTIKEIPIPTYYGDEICYVNGWKYAWDVCVSALASRLHRAGILYQRKFDLEDSFTRYDLKLGYASSHQWAIDAVPRDSTVLDLACGPGLVAAELKKKGCRLTGVDREQPPEEAFDRFVLHDLNAPALPPALGQFDVIVALDSLEHIRSPERLLECLRDQCAGEGTRFIMTTPNIGFVVIRWALMFGQFNYGRRGILDLTHCRLFTFSSFIRMLRQEGFRIGRVRGIPAPIPKALGDHWFSRWLLALNRAAIALSKRLFAYQIYVEATVAPPLDMLLTRTIAASTKRRSVDSEASGGETCDDVAEPPAQQTADEADQQGHTD